MVNSKRYDIAILAGDGIGPQVTEQTFRILSAAAGRFGFILNQQQIPCGVDYYLAHGTVVPDNLLETLVSYDAIFLGALGWPDTMPDHIAIEPIIRIRQAFDQYAAVRPAKTRPGVQSPLRLCDNVDMLVIRENSEGEYVSCGGHFHPNQSDQIAVQTAIHTRKGVERILRYGFEQARRRRKHLTLVTKSNALVYGMVFWDEMFNKVRTEFADIQSDKQHVDAAAMNIVRRPQSFDVIVASNLFGDILTDLSGAIVGGLGLNPSANINPDRTFPSMFEPVHGSAPDIAEKGIANPVGAILSGAMMLDWLGECQAASAIEAAVEQTLAGGHATPDIEGGLGTREMGDRILDQFFKDPV